jgi:hypothetical protein
MKPQSFSSEEALLAHLAKLPFEHGEAVAIVAGHFMLMYDDQLGGLVPMVYQDTTNPRVERLSRDMAGDFPLSTFRCGLAMREKLIQKGSPASLVLLVNDHIYLTPGWAVQNMPPSRGDNGSIRKKFHRSQDAIPASFQAELKARQLSPEAVLLDNNNPRRTKTDIVPKRSMLFSEQQLRRRFDETTRATLLADKHFIQVSAHAGKYELFFREEEFLRGVCLTENGTACGCSGEVVELMMSLSKRNIRHVVFFSPDECIKAVEAGAQASIYACAHILGERLSVTTLSGFGGMGVAGNERSRRITATFQRSSDI